MQDSLDMTWIIFIALAIFVAWRLRSVLGQKTGQEKPPFDPFSRRDPPAGAGPAAQTGRDNIVRLPSNGNERPAAPAAPVAKSWAGIAEPGSKLAEGLDEIARVEPEFDAPGFVQGAKGAYEMVVLAFAQGDRKALKSLLSREVYDGFERAIADREKRGEKSETTFVSLDKAEIIGVEVKNRVAQVTLRFACKLITATRDSAGKVVDGDPETVADVTDTWTFARTLGTRDPNWQLVATEAGQ